MRKTIKWIAGTVALFAILISGIKIAYAVQHSIISVLNTKGNITVNGNNIDNLTITPALVFNKTEDAITYQMTLKSSDDKAFQIKNITDDNTNQYIKTSYDYPKTKNIDDKLIKITLTYATYVPLGEDLDLNDIKIIIDIDEDDDDPELPVPNTSSSTSDNTNNNINSKTPNTGQNDPTRFLKASSAASTETLLPNILVVVIGSAILLTILPSRKSRINFTKASFVFALVLVSGLSTQSIYAKSSRLEILIKTANISAIPDTTNPEEVVSVIFPNIYNVTDADPYPKSGGNTILIKTLDNKYIMLDTGMPSVERREMIYEKLKGLQGTQKVNIDYLIISHLDIDHYGNAEALMKNENFNFKNLVLKHEIYSNGFSKDNIFKTLAQTAFDKNINIVTNGDTTTKQYLNSIGVINYDKISEGMVIGVGKYLRLNLFNTTNVYDGKVCMTGYALQWTANANSNSLYKNANGEYIYFDGSEYQTLTSGQYNLASSKFPYSNVTFKTTTAPIAKPGGSGMNRYFYAVASANPDHNICGSNPNSIGVLAEVTTTNLRRYMYFPGDLENAGYSRLSSGCNTAQIFENITFENGDFKTNITPYSIPSEDNTATAIYDKLAADANNLGLSVNTLLNNIVIYQDSHHGINNSEKAIDKLKLNRSNGIYAIAETASNMANTTDWFLTKTYYYTLSNIPTTHKLHLDKTKNGIDCSISTNGVANCAHY